MMAGMGLLNFSPLSCLTLSWKLIEAFYLLDAVNCISSPVLMFALLATV